MTVREEIVATLYDVALKRQPGSEELAFWVAKLDEQGSIPAVIRAFFDSDEYRQKNGTLPGHPPGHYYSPIVNPLELSPDHYSKLRQQVEKLAGIDLRLNAQLEVWNRICACPEISEDRYTPNNGTYGRGDALVLSGMLNLLRPKRFIEIGSGYSSARLLDTIDQLSLNTSVTFIEPFPQTLNHLLKGQDATRHDIRARPIQQVELEVFNELDAGDILFIDSTHVLKTGSDVHYEMFEILPSLKPGVLVHFHDIFWPFEYPPGWIFHLRYSWNELYMVRLLLMGGSFEIEFFNDAFARFQADAINNSPQHATSAMNQNPGGGLWLRRR